MRTAVTVQTFVGPLSFLWDDDALGLDADGRVVRGAVVRSAFVSSARFPKAGATVIAPEATTGDLALVVAAVRAWSEGEDRDALDVVPVLQVGGEFRQRCWQALRAVKAGEFWTYTELATAAGNAKAVRAAGSAMANNAVAPFVPCHRVLRTDGAVGNYSATGGAATKFAILEHEGVEFV